MGNADLHLKLVSTGVYLPEKIVTNEDFRGREMFSYDSHGVKFGKSVTQNPDSILGLSGIETRHIAGPNDTASYMGLQAAIKAIDEYRERHELDLKTFLPTLDVILGTVSEYRNVPNGATKIVKGLSEHYGVRLENSLAYDSANACAGFAEAVLQANSRVLRRPRPKLVVVSEDVSGMTSDDDMNLILFSAGAGAGLFMPTTESVGVYGDVSFCDPYDGCDGLICRDYVDPRLLRMPNGKEVFRRAPKAMLDAVEKLRIQLGWDKFDFILPHQANGRITRKMQELCPDTPILDAIKDIGNMSGVTCVYTLDQVRKFGVSTPDGRLVRLEKGMRYAVVGLGGGIAIAAYANQT